MPKISIILRTKNEERWIGHCLKMIQKQTIKDYEIILVDNASTDNTIGVAERHGIDRLVQVDPFKPGHALNEGIRASSGEYITCLSAHCIPKDEYWLNNLLKNFSESKGIAGVYGRQLPVSFTDPVDKRDLLIVFGLDKRIQVKDYFFHNANSMIPRVVWEKYPFDEEVTNIEDRVWGKKVIEVGYKLIYEPDASVYHHHGLHQGNDRERAKGVVSILEKVDKESFDMLPETMLPENIRCAALIPINDDFDLQTKSFDKIKRLINTINASKVINSTYLITSNNITFENAISIDRRVIPNDNQISIDKLLMEANNIVNTSYQLNEVILYINYQHTGNSVEYYDNIVRHLVYSGLDTIFPASLDYGHYWYQDNNGQFKKTDDYLNRRSSKPPIYKAHYGLGTATFSHILGGGKLVGERVGILPIKQS